MEGRTIVRPDTRKANATGPLLFTFNGGPDNRPARPEIEAVMTDHRFPSMEGRTIVRPDSHVSFTTSLVSSTLQWRAGQSSGQTLSSSPVNMTPLDLQWRAGQSSGQTHNRGDQFRARVVPSMEGRTIVRPDKQRQVTVHYLRSPSMEGRTIVRPDCDRPRPIHACRKSFNGGPDNRPARHGTVIQTRAGHVRLQWRAGQSSGQTVFDHVAGFGVLFLQWRAGQSSGQTATFPPALVEPCILQWRAGQSSGQTSGNRRCHNRPAYLQWRAGQSSGQTGIPSRVPRCG